MSPTTPAPPSDARLARAQLGLLATVACMSLVSIFAAEVCLALAVVIWIVRLARGGTRLVSTPLDGPILAFAVWTLLSASFSGDPVVSHENAKKLVLFSLLYLTVDCLRDDDARRRVVDTAVLGGLALGLGVLLQRYYLGFDTLEHRPHSFIGHYMTASGLLMTALVLSAVRLAYRGEPWRRPVRGDVARFAVLLALLVALTALQRLDIAPVLGERLFVAFLAGTAFFMTVSSGPWPHRGTSMWLAAASAPICAWAMIESQTRSAWLGTLGGLAVLAMLRAPRAILGLGGAVLALLLVVRPAALVSRLTVHDASSVDRIYMWQAGIDMIMDKPIFGQGPDMILRTYPSYRWREAPNPRTPHLHDNALQIAAERGLPCLVWWLWWLAVALGEALRVARRGGERAIWGACALAVLAALLVAGLFEYNFGDSEVLLLVLIVSALPFTLRPLPAVAPC